MSSIRYRPDFREWAGVLTAALAILACYGTSLAVLGLSLLGVTLALDEGIWAGLIGVFAVLAVLGISSGYLRHRKLAPAALAAVGGAAVIWSMFGAYDWIVELGGLAALAVAAGWDWRLMRSHRKKEKDDDGSQV